MWPPTAEDWNDRCLLHAARQRTMPHMRTPGSAPKTRERSSPPRTRRCHRARPHPSCQVGDPPGIEARHLTFGCRLMANEVQARRQRSLAGTLGRLVCTSTVCCGTTSQATYRERTLRAPKCTRVASGTAVAAAGISRRNPTAVLCLAVRSASAT